MAREMSHVINCQILKPTAEKNKKTKKTSKLKKKM